MLESLNKNHQILCFLWIIFSFSFLQAQDKAIPEKVYLHTDRSIYFLGEDLWYKAYNVNANTNLLSDKSNVLYVELIASDSKIIARNKTNLEVGLGNGDFQLADTLGVKPGHYQLRAYTNWNRNFGDDFVFKKDIEIFDVFESHDKSKTPQNSATETNIDKKETTKENTFKVDFFPEGGSLLENVASIVGFKAVDTNGNPIEISGEVFDSNNEFVTSFVSVHDGMGKFRFIPIKGKQYYAKIKTGSEIELRSELPKAIQLGYLLNYSEFKDKNIVTVNTNPETLLQRPNEEFTVVCKAKGISYLETTRILTETSFSFELPKDKTPEGISQITLLDSNLKPQSERLIYIEKEQDFEVQLTTEKSTYKPEEKTTINITSKTKAGTSKSASFSLSVTDTNGVDADNFDSNICSYFLMESDIRGKVHNPAYYFDSANSKRLEHLDNVLLTHGWRDFLWKTMPKNNGNFKAEKGITISGSVKQLFGEKPLVNHNLALALFNEKHQNIFSTVTDSNGSFQFENLMFSEMTYMYLNTTNEKGKFRGELILDPIEISPISVALENETIIFSETTKAIVENVFKKYTAIGVEPENMLNDVVIKAKKKRNRFPDYSFEVNQKEANKYYTFYEYLMEKLKRSVPKIFESGRPFSIKIGGFGLTDMNELLTLFPDQVIKVEVRYGDSVTSLYGKNSVVTIFTNKIDGGQHPEKPSMFSIRQKVKGFSTARVFYVPAPEKTDLELYNSAAVRNTLYWNPFIHPDKTGNTSLNYYNTKLETKVKVALEGITGSGIPVVKKVYYTIKK